MTGIDKTIGGTRLTFYADSAFAYCACCHSDFGTGRWFHRHFWESGPEKMIQRAVSHVLGHVRKEQEFEARARFAADYADAVLDMFS